MNRRQYAAERISVGSGRLALDIPAALIRWVKSGKKPRNVAQWVASGSNWFNIIVRFVVVVVLGGIVVWVLWRILKALPTMWVLSAAWLYGAWRAGKDVPRPSAEAAADQTEAAPSGAGMRRLLVGLIGSRNGVHLVDVLAHLQKMGHAADWSVSDLRSRLASLGIPVRRTVKVAGRSTLGVHRDDLAAPSPSTGQEQTESSSTAA